MRALIFLSTLCTALTLAGCAQPDKQSSNNSPVHEFVYDERDAIPNDVPLPKPGINQRPVVGTKKVLVSVVQWQGERTLDKSLIESHTFPLSGNDNLKNYIEVASKGKLTLQGQVIEHTSGPRPEICKNIDPYKPPMPLSLATAEGEKAARANGLDPASFDYLINVIDCGGNASAYMPGRLIGVYGQAGSPHVYKHEFGHSLGYAHPETYTKCQFHLDTVWAPNSCSPIAFGDTGDPVGGGAALYPVNNRWYSGWLDNSQIETVNKTGKYVLARSGSSPSPITPPVLLLINRNSPPRQIALEFRENMMFDTFPPGDNRLTGVWIRFTDMENTLKNYQLDATPKTASIEDPTLQPGETLRDSDKKINVKFCGYAGAHASLAISLNDEPIPNCN
ncbi:transposase [Pseudomonas izuensis]|uniref:Transposase n=1 Tax=Pseudomonas izuensis TaxID=2684212 RepID=A0ABM7RMK9_9PSED|nr:transposase [Pseudomonas izuensis]BCX66435.1 transposase [Pseudomonas izuensis]